jgi:CubicO group peptidase (beta-lactamase class C family)
MTASQTRGSICLALVLALMQAGLAFRSVGFAQQTNDSFPKELDEYVATAVRDTKIPGLAIAIVKDGKVIVAKGYGVRELGKPELVNEDTIFDAASLSKSFNAAAIASLVDEKKMMWDAPVRRYLPTLEFPDPYLTANVTIRDLLSHRTGMHASNGPAFFASVSRSQLLGLIKNMKVVAPFRTQFIYSNVGVTAAGEAAAVAAGTTWEDLISQRFIIPLGMQRTTPVFSRAPAMGNIASGHAFIYSTGKQIVTLREGMQRDVTGPAGAIQSSARDLATWMIFQLGDGTFQGKRILSADALAEMHALQTIIYANEAFRRSRQIGHFGGYCLGWQVYYYRGNRMIWHTGSGDGQAAYMTLLPESRLGVVVLSNSWKGGTALNIAIASRIVDYYLGLPTTRDYVGEFRESSMRSTQQQMEALRQFEASQIRNTKPTLPLAEYAGVYRDQFGLEVKVWLEGDHLRLQYGGGEVAEVIHWNYDTFRVRWDNPLHADQRSTLAQFVLSPQGKVSEIQMDFFGDRLIGRR